MNFYKISSIESAAKYLAELLSSHLKDGKKLLWLVTGGSAITVAAQASKLIDLQDQSNLYVTLTDERYVPVGDKDSNWQQLLDVGFKLPNAHLFPVLKGKSMDDTTTEYGNTVRDLLDKVDYRVGLFGMGPDGHIAALFPEFNEVKEGSLYATSLNNSPKPPPLRMTITPPSLSKLDEAIIFATGEQKKSVIDKVELDIEPSKQPAQLLKNLPRLTILNDSKGERL